MENTNNNHSTETKKDLLTLKSNGPAEFNPVGETALTTTNELANTINKIMKNLFADYYGCSVAVQFNSQIGTYVLSPSLYFKVLPKNQYDMENNHYGFTPLDVQNDKSDVLGRVQRIASTITTVGPKVAITDDCKNVMKDFLNVNNVEKFDWNTAYAANVIGDNTFVRMFRLDILKFLKFIYGDKDSKGGECFYQPSVIRSITQQAYAVNDNWSVQILRLNWSAEQYSAQQMGFAVNAPNAPANIVRA